VQARWDFADFRRSRCTSSGGWFAFDAATHAFEPFLPLSLHIIGR
jgi:hypothetical protein